MSLFLQITEIRHIASVNSFGFGGTNAHVVMEEFRGQETGDRSSNNPLPLYSSNPLFLLPFSAKTPEALQELCRSYLDFFENPNTDHSLADIGYTAGRRRSHHSYRMAIVAHSKEEIRDNLNAFLIKENRRGLAEGKASEQSAEVGLYLFRHGAPVVGNGTPTFRTE